MMLTTKPNGQDLCRRLDYDINSLKENFDYIRFYKYVIIRLHLHFPNARRCRKQRNAMTRLT